jgi:FAD/FMN-containing dehydrogenase
VAHWAGDQACEPAVVERPASTADVVAAVERAVAAGLNVRPDPLHSGPRALAAYPDWERFQSMRRELDPTGVFANAYTDRVLGPVGAHART